MKKVYRMSEAQFEAIIGKKQIYNNGYKANRTRHGLEKNPHEKSTPEHNEWRDGWLAAEAKSQADHDDAMLSREIGESEEIVNEVNESENIFTNRIKSGFDLDIRFNDLFPGLEKPGTKGDTIVVDGVEYDPYIEINEAVVKYSIEIEYKSYGIRDIYINPVSAYFIGVLELTGDDDSFNKDFELEFDLNGLKTNTLSGAMSLGEKTITVADIGSEVKFEVEKTENTGNSFYVSAVDLILQPNRIIFKY
jgi:hypothetical protein